MTYLVTGGAGFIGSNIVEHLIAKTNHNVVVLDNFTTGHKINLEHLASSRLRIIPGDIRSLTDIEQAVKGVDVIFHLAALGSVPRSVADPLTTHAVNTTGTLNVLIAAQQAGVRRVVFSSSSSVYGGTGTRQQVETMKPIPASPYAISKLSGEYYCQVFTKIFGLSTVVLRYFNVFGPRQDPASKYAAVIPRFVIGLSSGKSLTIYGDGTQSRDFTYVENVVEANILAATKNLEPGGIFNIANGENTSINILLEQIQNIMGTNRTPSHEAARVGDIKKSHALIIKAKEKLGWSPTFTFKQGLNKTIDWYTIKNRRNVFSRLEENATF